MAVIVLPEYFGYSEKIILVTCCPLSYGHVFETMFHAYDVLNSDKVSDSKVLLCIPPKMNNMLGIANLF